MGRLAAYQNLKTHPWYGPKVMALTAAQEQRIVDFVTEHDALSGPEFTTQVYNKLQMADKKTLLLIEILAVINQEVCHAK
jgi:hypothetical protein